MAFVPYSLICANRENPEKCGWFSGHACGFKGCDPQPECYLDGWAAAIEQAEREGEK
jgi:hypothetical protein